MYNNNFTKYYDIIVVGAGHAGCEASLACARLKLKTILFTMSIDNIALMPCNPSIGGNSKGHLVKEIDALGGEMAKNIDKTFIQSKMLNLSKGPAVHSLRAQADKNKYSKNMKIILENTKYLTIKQAEVIKILISNNKAKGVKIYSGLKYFSKAVILCTGTYLRSKCIFGNTINYTGPNGLKSSNYLTKSLKKNGIKMNRFKTGTSARIDKRSINFSKLKEQFGDKIITPFSFFTNSKNIQIKQISCWLTHTNKNTHNIIKNNLNNSPLYTGIIKGIGPRYCPSIEDKIVKFPNKNEHQIFLEPEGINTNEIYISGLSTSMPENIQYSIYHSIKGLEQAIFTRNAYAIEYDCIDARQLYPTLEFNSINGLFSCGQFNGSSGYEEAAAQGIIAGINASMKVLNRKMLILTRSEAYIGVLIDDLVTKKNLEPYRMMTSHAEYRLLLRQDNADLRLIKKGYKIGLINYKFYKYILWKKQKINNEIIYLKKTFINKKIKNKYKIFNNVKNNYSLAKLIQRHEFSYNIVFLINKNKHKLSNDIITQININIKYNGYIKRQLKQINTFKLMEKKIIPKKINYNEINGLRIEAKQKLKKYKPISIGQASRIAGVSPADISVLIIYIKKNT